MSGKWYFYKHDENLNCSKVVPVLDLAVALSLSLSLSLAPSFSVCTTSISDHLIQSQLSRLILPGLNRGQTLSTITKPWLCKSTCITTKQPDLNLEICPKHLIKIFAINFYITITVISEVQEIAFVLKLIFIICWMSFMHIKFGRK